VVAESWRSPSGRHRQLFYFLECPDWVNVIPVDARGRVILIRQSRYGSRRVELEIPGGAVDRRDASPLAAAKRELMEETGCVAKKWISLGFVNPNPAFHRNKCHMFLALGVRKLARQTLDDAEDITITPVPLGDIPGLIRRGRISHSIVIAAFFCMHDKLGLLRSPSRR
jgi:8-oxo-dGTP pyrophosphatase MutT (NUDIX family)